MCSATLTAFPPGVLITSTPRRVASSRSMLSTPTPARPTTRSRRAFSSSSGVTFVALRTTNASASAISASSVSLVVRTMFHPALCSSSTPRSLILSATITFIGPHVICLKCTPPACESRRKQGNNGNGAIAQCQIALTVRRACRSRADAQAVLFRRLFDRTGPVREMIQRLRIGRVKMERSDRHCARENRGIVRVRRDIFVDALLE